MRSVGVQDRWQIPESGEVCERFFTIQFKHILYTAESMLMHSAELVLARVELLQNCTAADAL